MKKLNLLLVFTAVLFAACDETEDTVLIEQGDYPVKEYYLERDPRVNTWGVGIDLIHEECQLTETELDYSYMSAVDSFPYDLKFYVVKAYYYDDLGDLKSEGCPAILFSADAKACQIGTGISFFDSLSTVTEEMRLTLDFDHPVDYDIYKNDNTGFYERAPLFASLDSCIIGRSFRSNVLVVPEGSTEEETQAVYLVETKEGGYAKFMVKLYQGPKPYEKQTLFRWQVIAE